MLNGLSLLGGHGALVLCKYGKLCLDLDVSINKKILFYFRYTARFDT